MSLERSLAVGLMTGLFLLGMVVASQDAHADSKLPGGEALSGLTSDGLCKDDDGIVGAGEPKIGCNSLREGTIVVCTQHDQQIKTCKGTDCEKNTSTARYLAYLNVVKHGFKCVNNQWRQWCICRHEIKESCGTKPCKNCKTPTNRLNINIDSDVTECLFEHGDECEFEKQKLETKPAIDDSALSCPAATALEPWVY